MSATDQTIEQETPKRPGRPKRAETTQTERRRRKGGTTHKLKVPDHIVAAHPDMEFRWGRDDEGRIQQLTQNDDWDMVPEVDPIHAGTGKAGNAIQMHLLMKPKEFMAQDRAEKQAMRDAQLKDALARPDVKQATEAGAEMYSVPGNKIKD
tara:strand:- start:8808 stop:9260 length:453 start_codon:yes stop_codon:yes gene_type:complete